MKINQELAGYNEQNNNKKKYKDKNARLRTVVSRFADNFEDSAQYIQSVPKKKDESITPLFIGGF
jgi:hypothetical protein